MTDINETALEEAADEGRYLFLKDLLMDVERYDEDVDRGVPLDRLEAYVDELVEQGVHAFDVEELDELVAADLTDSDTWSGPDAIYEVADGISAFPSTWHDELAGEEDLMVYVDFISGDLWTDEKHTATGGAGGGVPQELLLDVASTFGPYSRDGVRAEIARLREEGAVEETTDDHPKARIWPAHE